MAEGEEVGTCRQSLLYFIQVRQAITIAEGRRRRIPGRQGWIDQSLARERKVQEISAGPVRE